MAETEPASPTVSAFARSFGRAFAHPFRAEPLLWMTVVAVVGGLLSYAPPRWGGGFGYVIAAGFLFGVIRHTAAGFDDVDVGPAELRDPEQWGVPLFRVATVTALALGPGVILVHYAQSDGLVALAFAIGGALLPAMVILVAHGSLGDALHPKNLVSLIGSMGFRYVGGVVGLAIVVCIAVVFLGVARELYTVRWVGHVLAWFVGLYPAFVGARWLGMLAR